MKVIHTADWHLGNNMHEIDRNEEVDFFFQQLKDHIVDSKAETLIVSGDIFDTINPPNEAKKKYYNFLTSLKDTCCKNIIITGGNHDSPSLLETTRELLESLNIHVTGTVSNKTAADLVFPLYDENNEIKGVCAAVPFVREIELRNFMKEENKEFNADKCYKELYNQCLEEALKIKGDKNIPLVACGHLFAANLEGRYKQVSLDESGKSKLDADDGVRDIVGNLGHVSSSVFPEAFDYVALGHIHYNTKVDGYDKIQYSGSPFCMGFDEVNIPRCVLEIDFEGENINCIKKLPVKSCLKFVRFTGTVDEIKKQIKEFNCDVSPEKVFAEICYDNKGISNIHDQLQDYLENAPFNVVSWKLISEAKAWQSAELEDVEELGEISSEEIFRKFIAANLNAKDPSEIDENEMNAYLEIFNWGVKAVEENENENPEN